jgi:hypothetical protein
MNFPSILYSILDRDGLVGIMTLYDLDGQVIESRSGAKFSTLIQTVPFAKPASYTMVTGSLQWVKRAGALSLSPTAI